MLWPLAALLLLIAAALLTSALRGKRVGAIPHCRHCNFNLHGLDVAGATEIAPRCPECGRPLNTPRAIARGERRRRPALLTLALLLLAASLALGALGLSASNSSLNKSKPTWLLMIEATRLGGTPRDAAAAELLARHANSPLSNDRLAALVAPALQAQGDAAIQWDKSPWWELLDGAFSTGGVTESQLRVYLENALADLGTDIPEAMLAAEPWPRRVEDFEPDLLAQPRLAPAQQIAYIVTLESAALDGVPLELVETSSRDGRWSATLNGYGVRPAGWGFSGHSTHSSIYAPFPNHKLELASAPPGKHTLSLTHQVRAFAGTNLTVTGGSNYSVDLEEPTLTFTMRSTHEFTSYAAVEEITSFADPEAVSFDPTITIQSGAGLNAQSLLTNRTDFYGSFSREELREGTPWIVGRIELRSGNDRWPAVESWPLDSPVPVTIALAAPPDTPQGAGLPFAVANLPRLGKFDVVIVPDLRAAAVAGIRGQIWPKEIVIPDVPINWPQATLPSGRSDDPAQGDEPSG